MIEFVWLVMLLGSAAGMYVTRRTQPAYHRWTLAFGVLLVLAVLYIVRHGPLRVLLNLFLFFEWHPIPLTVLFILSIASFTFAWRGQFTRGGVVIGALITSAVALCLVLGWYCLLAVLLTGLLFSLLWQQREERKFVILRWIGAAMIASLAADLFVSYIFFESLDPPSPIEYLALALVLVSTLLALWWAWYKTMRVGATVSAMIILVSAAGVVLFAFEQNVSKHMDLAGDVALTGLIIVFVLTAALWILRAKLQPLGWVSAVLVLFLGGGLFLTSILYGEPEDFVDIEDQFKYGSIGSDHFLARGIPYYIWKVLPTMFPPEDILTGWILPRQSVDKDLYRPRYGKFDEKGTSYEAFGLLRELNRNVRVLASDEEVIQSIDRPIGFSKRHVFGVDFVGINCAFCHTSRIRTIGEVRHSDIVLGMPANTVDIELFFLYLFGVAERPDFDFWNGKVMAAILELDQHLKLGKEVRERGLCAICQELKNSFHRLTYRWGLIPLTGYYVRRLKKDFAFIDPQNPGHNPRFGPGRVDAWSPGKRTLIKPPLPVDYPGGIIDDTSIWNQKARNGMRFHWDGNTNDINERNIIAGLVVNGPQIECLDIKRVSRITDWIMERPAPRLDDLNRAVNDSPDRKDTTSPYGGPRNFCGDKQPPKTDAVSSSKTPALVETPESPAATRLRLIEEGKGLFQHWCASCHAPDGSRIGRVEPLDATELRTDPARMRAFNLRLQNALNAIGRNSPYAANEDGDIPAWKLRKFRAQDGYVNMLLDGIWLRAPYLHNGSVPTLWQLLSKPCQSDGRAADCRWTMFYRGNEAYDTDQVGFKYDVAEGDDRWQTIQAQEAKIKPHDQLRIVSPRGDTLEAKVDDEGMVKFSGTKIPVLDSTAAEALTLMKQHPDLSIQVDELHIRRNMKARFFLFDTTVAGNSNHGHLYGTDLPCEQKAALLEFLKTL